MTKNNLLITKNNIWAWAIDNPVKTIIITGVIIRLVLAMVYQHITLYPDSEDYFVLAKRLLIPDLSGYEGQRSPGYPVLLAISNLSHIVTILLQACMGIVTLILIYKTCLALDISKKISLIVTLILTFYLPTIFFEFSLLSETLTLLFIILVFYLFFNIWKNKSTHYLLLGLSCGYLVLIKPFYIFLPTILFILFFLKNLSNRKHLLRAIYILIFPAIMFLGWSYVNKTNTGYFTSTTFYGFNLAQNCVSFAEKTTPEYTEIGEIYAKYRDNRISDKEIAMTIWEAYPELEEKTGLSFPDLSKKLYDYSITTIKENPGEYIKQVFISWRDFWKTSLYWEYDSVALPYANNIILYICYAERILLQLLKIMFVLLIPYNIIRSISKRKLTTATIVSLIVLIASVLQALATYGTNSRFSFPFEVVIVLSVLLNIIEYRKKLVIHS